MTAPALSSTGADSHDTSRGAGRRRPAPARVAVRPTVGEATAGGASVANPDRIRYVGRTAV
jgi:hypothetical protein